MQSEQGKQHGRAGQPPPAAQAKALLAAAKAGDTARLTDLPGRGATGTTVVMEAAG